MNEEQMLADLGDQAFDKGKENIANAQYFTGKSYVNNLASTPTRVTNVVFEPGSINDWHIHHGMSQILLVTGGTGWYQEWGKKPQKLKKGDVITKINDSETKSTAYFRYELYKYNINDEITITYIRDGKVESTKIKLSKKNSNI